MYLVISLFSSEINEYNSLCQHLKLCLFQSKCLSSIHYESVDKTATECVMAPCDLHKLQRCGATVMSFKYECHLVVDYNTHVLKQPSYTSSQYPSMVCFEFWCGVIFPCIYKAVQIFMYVVCLLSYITAGCAQESRKNFNCGFTPLYTSTVVCKWREHGTLLLSVLERSENSVQSVILQNMYVVNTSHSEPNTTLCINHLHMCQH